MYRIGYSEDIHQIKKGRKLFLGGLLFEGFDGLDGHSDADVVLHALAESILGALALGDLGSHFPDSDPKYKDISSSILVKEVVGLMEKHGYSINNVDIQVACKSPKLSNRVLEMRQNLASLLKTNLENVSIKAMSFNGVGPIGNGEAIKASCIVLLKKI